MTPEIVARIDHELERRILTPYLTRHFWWMGRGEERMNNWTAWITQNVLLATFLLHAVGFALGYGLARMLGLGEVEARTISIEVGMQNSGLGSGLAKTPAFAAQFADVAQAALAPVPAAISAVWHVVIGSLLAGWWRRRS